MNPFEMPPRVEQSGGLNLHQYFLIARRGKWLILGAVTLCTALAWSYCVMAPQYYRSETLILSEEPKFLENVARGAEEGNIEQRIFVITRQILSREILGEIAREFNLYPEGLDENQEALALQAIAGKVMVEMLKTDKSDAGLGRINAFTVSFMHEDPVTTTRVTERIAEKFIQANTKEREKDAEGASQFFDDELRAIKLDLENKEDQLSRFKKSHLGELPQQTDFNLRALDRLELEINSVNESLQRQSDKLAMLDKAVQDFYLYGRQNSSISTALTMEPDSLYRRLKESNEKLVKLRSEFSDEYPEVILTKEEIRQVKAELVQLYGPDALKPDKTPLSPYAQDLSKLQNEAKSELSLLKQRLQILLASKRDHEKRVDRFPEVEQELLVLERDYNNMKNNYTMLLDKRLHARVTENVEKRQKGGKFRVLDPASFPRSPSVPNRPRVLVLGFLFGCVVGAGLVVIREQLTQQFRGPEDVELLAGPGLLAVIPDYSLLISSVKGNRFLPKSYLLRPRLGGIETTEYQRKEAERKKGDIFLQNGSRHGKSFLAQLFPRSMAAEQYRVAAARLLQLNTNTGSIVVGVTSALKGEGKTTTVINLGYTLARDFGKRVLLLDCDLASPELKRFAETPTKYGLVDCFRGEIPLEEAMVSFADIPCSIMPAGESHVDSSELLRTDQLERILSQLREKFDYILINTPPILPVAAMNVLERHVDLLLLVVKANLTSQQFVNRALGSLRGSKPISTDPQLRSDAAASVLHDRISYS